MTLEVRWTKEAEYTFDTILIFIEEHWGLLSAEKFRSKTKKVIIYYLPTTIVIS